MALADGDAISAAGVGPARSSTASMVTTTTSASIATRVNSWPILLASKSKSNNYYLFNY